MRFYGQLFMLLALLFTLSGCEEEKDHFTLQGTIQGAEGQYIKYLNMLEPQAKADSIYLDMGGKFTFTKESTEPVDLILYFTPKESIRLMAGVNESIHLKAQKNNLLASYRVEGSPESALVAEVLRENARTIHTMDTLDAYYMKVQMHPNLDSIVEQLRYLSDSSLKAHRTYLENFINEHPSSLASYVALSMKLDYNTQFFRLPQDMPYFHKVDSAMMQRYDTVKITTMLHAYVSKNKIQSVQKPAPKALQIGDTVPEICLPNVAGDTLCLSELRGQVVLIDFWGTWCKPSRDENKNLRAVYYTYKNKGFQVFQVAIDHNKEDWKNTIREDKLGWKYQVSDLQYMKSPTAKSYRLQAMPANFLVDKRGVILAKDVYGEDLWHAVKDALQKTQKPVASVAAQ